MSLASELVTLNEEIKTKQTPWLALSAKANDDSQTLTTEDKDQLTAGNKALTELIDKKVALETQITEQATLKTKVDGMTALEQEATEKARSSAPTDKGDESWAVKAAKAMLKDFPNKDHPHIIEKGLKALFVEGAFTAGTAAGVPGYYEPGSDQGYPPELRREPSLFTPDAVRPVQFWNTIQQIPTNRPTDVYMVETVNADADAPFTAEGGAYVEDPGFDYNEASNPIKDLGVFYPASKDILEDEPMMESILQMRVAERMSRRLDNAFLNQVGSASAFTGILQITGFPTFAKEADEPLQVSITRAIEAINGPSVTGITGSGGQAMTDAIYVTVPVYWEFMRQQDALGNFMVSMGLREAPQLRVAGIPVMQCQALPAGNILVMDRMYTHIRDRRAVQIYWMERMAVASTHTVPTAQRMVVADARATISVRRLSANCLITGA